MKKSYTSSRKKQNETNNSVSGPHQGSQISRRTLNFVHSQTTRSFSLVHGRTSEKNHTQDRSADQAPNTAVKVFNDVGEDVTPHPLSHAEPGDMQSNPGRLFLDELFSNSESDHSFSSRQSSLRTATALTKDTQTNSIPQLDMPINPPTPSEVLYKTDNVEQYVTGDTLVDIYITETDTITLLDIPSTIVSEDDDDAEAIKERNIYYTDLCKRKMGSDKYVARSTQTFNGALKSKPTQTVKIVTADEGASASVSDAYDSFCDQNETPESEKSDHAQSSVNTSTHQTKRGQHSGSSSTAGMDLISSGSTISSQLQMESNLQQIMSSESFQHNLLVMERMVMADDVQLKLAVYRGQEDPDSTGKPRTEEQSKEGEEGEEGSSLSPALECLWTFSCKLTSGYNITSMAWNKENTDLLAVGYGDCDPRNQKPGLICGWSVKNHVWPERVLRCHSCVTCLDFSATNPALLAVGMYDGTVAIYNVQNQDVCRIADSSKCLNKHLEPVWQVKWILEMKTFSEVVVSVSADGRVSKWLPGRNGLNCIDLMKLKKPQECQETPVGNKKKKRREKEGNKKKSATDTLTALCVDFHPIQRSIYLVGTKEGSIHKGSISNRQDFLQTYQKHFHPVNHIEWSPFHSDVFLSCSSDRTIRMWKQDRLTPLMSFTTTQKAVHAVRWSPNRTTIFAANTGQQMEIWDLNSSIRKPIIVHHAAVGVKMTFLLFSRGTDCILVGDSDGQVTVYQLKNLSVGEGKQVDSLEDIILKHNNM